MDSELENILVELLSNNMRCLENQSEIFRENIDFHFWQNISYYIEEEFYKCHIRSSVPVYNFLENQGLIDDLKSSIRRVIERIEETIHDSIICYSRNLYHIFKDETMSNEEKLFMINKETGKFDSTTQYYADKGSYVEVENLNRIIRNMSYYYGFENNYNFCDDLNYYLNRQKNNYEMELNEQIQQFIKKMRRKLYDNSQNMIERLQFMLMKEEKKEETIENTDLTELKKRIDEMINYVISKYKNNGVISTEELILYFGIFDKDFQKTEDGVYLADKFIQEAVDKITKSGIKILPAQTQKKEEDHNVSAKK